MKPRGYWVYETCKEEALKYTTRKTFGIGCSCAYEAARKNHWLDDICSHMTKNRLTIEKCHEIALKYESRSEFRKYDYDVYNLACGYHWLDEVCTHMSRSGNRIFRCIYVYEFSDNFAYVGLTYNLKERNANRKQQINDAVTKHIKKTGLQPTLKQLSEYVFIDVAKTSESECIEFYRNNGWNMLNITKGGDAGIIENKWTKEKCHVEALNFNTRTKFKEKNMVRTCQLKKICG